MKFLLPFLTAMLAVQSASAQSLWRNFFTTNRDPIVEVVAGSNATVQATTVGVNLRRFTVNSTASAAAATNVVWPVAGTNITMQTNGLAVTVNATGGGTVQTNISWTAVTNLQSAQVPYTVITNAPWQMGDSDLTNWATLNTNVLSTLGQTNISYTAVTNAPWQYGGANLTNWNQLTTNVLGSLAQTNISYTAVTNAPWQYGSANLTNWGQLTTNVLGTLAQTNISLSAVTNANYLTNWATINTNIYVVKTGDTVSGPILTTSSTSNAPSATELVTANWVRNLFNSGADYYNTTNIDSGATNVGSSQPVYKFQSTIPISDARSYTTSDFLTNGGYVGSVITTNTFSQISGAALVTAFLGFTGGVGLPTLTLHPEIYYSYDKTNWYGDWSGTDESIVNGTTNIYQWAISIPVTTSTNVNGFYISRRFKVSSITGSGVRTLTVLIGTNAVSGTSTAGHVTMESPTATAGNAFLANNQVFTGSNYFTQPLTLSLATNTPSASQVLTATSASSAAWQTPAAGSGSSNITDIAYTAVIRNATVNTNLVVSNTITASSNIGSQATPTVTVGTYNLSGSAGSAFGANRYVDSGSGNMHGFSDSTFFRRNGAAYADFDAYSVAGGSGNDFDHLVGFQARQSFNAASSANTIQNIYSFLSIPDSTLGTATTLFHFKSMPFTGTATNKTLYGLYISSETNTPTVANYGIYILNGSNYLAGNTVFGGTITGSGSGITNLLTNSIAGTPTAGSVATAGSDGKVWWSNAPAGSSSIVLRSYINYAAAPTIYNGATRYFPLIGNGASGTENDVSIPFPTASTFTNFYVKPNVASAGTNITFTVYTNGVASNFAASCVGTGGYVVATNTTSSVSIAAGTLVSIGISHDCSNPITLTSYIMSFQYY